MDRSAMTEDITERISGTTAPMRTYDLPMEEEIRPDIDAMYTRARNDRRERLFIYGLAIGTALAVSGVGTAIYFLAQTGK